ncbi:MAG TPA: preprotein translocase subunit SecE [Candidatus Pacearchaeota archaeon]|nr:preprotein translocase subunit SecE [Candidatus Pacearchaeota archaeon]
MNSGGFFQKIGAYFSDVKSELKKVTWPARKDVLKLTLIVIGFTLLAALALGGMDFAIVSIFKLFLFK